MEIVITKEFITLGQLLKEVDLISSGGQAKVYLAENTVFVNGEKEARRGKKLVAGTRIQCPKFEEIVLRSPTVEESKELEEEILEKQRVTAIVKKMNGKTKRSLPRKKPKFPGV